MSQKLTLKEGLELDRCEQIIAKNEETVIEFIKAWIIIRDQRLYRAQFKTFEDYCQTKWQRTRGRINQMIREYTTKMELQAEGVDTSVIQSDRAALALSEAPKADRAEILKKIKAKGKSATAKAIKEAAKELKTIPIELDGTGYPVPKALLPIWGRIPEINALLKDISDIKGAIQRAQQGDDALFAEVNYTTLLGDLEKVYTHLKASKPFAVCMRCQGHPETQWEKCRLCFGRGVIGEFRYKTVPEEERKMREKGGKK